VSRRVARPYAAALFQVLQREPVAVLRTAEAQLEAVADLFRREPTLLRAFEVPTVAPARKKELLDEIGGLLDLTPKARRLLAALAQHYRLRFLPEVVALFRAAIDEREGMVRGSITLPAAPRPGQIDALAAVLRQSLATEVVLESEVEPKLLAGFVVRLGSRVYDGSLRTQLERFAASASSR
jgi:F-type H+-transporting ATPase subunit delta